MHLFIASAMAVPRMLAGPFRRKMFEQYQSDMHEPKGLVAFVLLVTRYSDASTQLNSGAGQVHPLRIRVECLDDDAAPLDPGSRGATAYPT